jgi:hypothetical protein
MLQAPHNWEKEVLPLYLCCVGVMPYVIQMRSPAAPAVAVYPFYVFGSLL